MRLVFWYAAQGLLSVFAGIFLIFGVSLLIGAFSLTNPFHFIMTIFASNLIILISATLLAGLCYRMYGVARLQRKQGRKEG